MAAIPSTFVLDDVPTPAQWNSPGLALRSIGLVDDNAGLAQWARTLGLPLALMAGLAGVSLRVVQEATSYTVPVGTVAVLRGASGSVSVTPSGGSAQTVVPLAEQGYSTLPIVLWPGDLVTCGGGAGVVLQLLPTPAGVSRFYQSIGMEPSAHYTVPAQRALVLLAVHQSGAFTIYIDDRAVSLSGGSPITANLYPALPPLVVAAGQKIEFSTAAWVNGLLFVTP